MCLRRQNAHLGNNLHIHPCNLVTAAFAEDTRPWEGSIITSYNSEFDNQDGHGHGVKLEPTCMVVSPPPPTHKALITSHEFHRDRTR